jgi:hypothetical protein
VAGRLPLGRIAMKKKKSFTLRIRFSRKGEFMIKDKKPNNVRWITVVTGLFSLFGAIVLLVLAPNILGWFRQTIKPTEMPPYNIPFTYSEGFGSGLTLHKVSAQKTGTDVEFRIDYTSDVDRGMSFFDPPAGDIISIQKNLPAGTNSVVIITSISALQKVSNITINFYVPGAELTGHVFLDFQQIKNILP